MRDVVMFAIVFCGLPFVLRWPYIGVLYWVWIGLMNPHRLAWGPAFDFPFAMLVAATTFVGMALSREEKRWKAGPEMYLMIILLAWMCITTMFALVPEEATKMLSRVLKIQLMIFVSLILLNTRRHVELMVAVLAVSVGFYGIKGGMFTAASGGSFRVWGPADSFIEDNNALALAQIMIIPLFVYLYLQARQRWLRFGIGLAIVLCSLSALGSYSRGGFVAIGAMALFLWLKSSRKVLLGGLLVILLPSLVIFMPSNWEGRMRSILEYQSDESALGRLDAWSVLTRIAMDRVTGGGFEPYTKEIYARYLSTAPEVHSAHSIYFQALGEHGFVGLVLFIAVWFFAWRCARQIRRESKGLPDFEWAYTLTGLIQVGLVGYFVGGTFLNLGYWDLPYYYMVLLVIMRDIVRRSAKGAPAVVPAASGVTPITPLRPRFATERVTIKRGPRG